MNFFQQLSKFVLGAFSPRETKAFDTVAEKVARALDLIIEKDVEKAMQECNS